MASEAAGASGPRMVDAVRAGEGAGRLNPQSVQIGPGGRFILRSLADTVHSQTLSSRTLHTKLRAPFIPVGAQKSLGLREQYIFILDKKQQKWTKLLQILAPSVPNPSETYFFELPTPK